MNWQEKVTASVMLGLMWMAGQVTGVSDLASNTLLGGFFAVWGLPFAWSGIKAGFKALGANIK